MNTTNRIKDLSKEQVTEIVAHYVAGDLRSRIVWDCLYRPDERQLKALEAACWLLGINPKDIYPSYCPQEEE